MRKMCAAATTFKQDDHSDLQRACTLSHFSHVLFGGNNQGLQGISQRPISPPTLKERVIIIHLEWGQSPFA